MSRPLSWARVRIAIAGCVLAAGSWFVFGRDGRVHAPAAHSTVVDRAPDARPAVEPPSAPAGTTERRPHRADATTEAKDAKTMSVEVLVFESSDDPSSDRRVPHAHVVLRDAKGGEHAVEADATGRAVVEGLPRGNVSVRSSAPGYVASEWREWDEEADRGRVVVVDLLDRATVLDGVVVDGRGRAVAGAEVVVVSAPPFWNGTRCPAIYPLPLVVGDATTHAHVTTGADGRFHAECVPPGRPVTVRARANCLGPAQMSVATAKLGERGEDVTVVVEPAGSVSGVVRDETGQPVPPGVVVGVVASTDAELAAQLAGGDLPVHDWGAEGLLAARTDTAGHFRVEGLRLGADYVVVATNGGWAPSVPAHVAVTASARDATVDLVLRRRGKVVIHVLGPDGAPPRESNAWIDTPGGWGGGCVPGTGVHTFECLVPGTWHVTARAPGSPPERAAFTVPSGGNTEVTVRLVAGTAWDAVVVDTAGARVANATVRAWHADGLGGFDSQSQAETNAEGRAHFTDLRGGAPHRVDAIAPGFARSTLNAEIVVVERADPSWIVLRPGGVVRGTVRDADGALTPACVVASGTTEERVLADDKGRFEMHVPPGRYSLTAGWDSEHGVCVDVTDGGTVEVALREGK